MRFKKIIEDIRLIFLSRIPPEPEPETEPMEIIEPSIVEAPVVLPTSDPSIEASNNPETSSVIDKKDNDVYSREIAYSELERIAAFLSTIEPHSPAPYLIRRAIQWGGMNLAELYEDLLINEGNLAQIMRLLGLGIKEIPLANQTKKR